MPSHPLSSWLPRLPTLPPTPAMLLTLLLLCASLLPAAAPARAAEATAGGNGAHAAAVIEGFLPQQQGHHVGGVAADFIGNVYVADFDAVVWKISPEGEAAPLVTNLYGASGNAVDLDGDLLQAEFYRHRVVRIDRAGKVTPFITEGLAGPVGITIERQSGDVYIANCRGNTISRHVDGKTTKFAESPLMSCPNGLAFGPEKRLYTVNFRDNKMLKIDPDGKVSLFAEITETGLGHLVFVGDRFYVTAFHSHRIYTVSPDGKDIRLFAGNGTRGVTDGDAAKALLSYPNGIALDPGRRMLYINEFHHDEIMGLPRAASVRRILLPPPPPQK